MYILLGIFYVYSRFLKISNNQFFFFFENVSNINLKVSNINLKAIIDSKKLHWYLKIDVLSANKPQTINKKQ